ncbi:MAG: hypothetical protein QOD53_1189 [Thermoleophilaceae bacterium]|jgi:glyoxylase-like metal-dependent hydrolase (beta-lactamase superfamily II)|nr:hypothetical protein [Thermoleophilaceae bacterium]
MASSNPTQVADGVYTLGWPMFNWFVVEDGGRLTVVDCGMPKFWDQVEPGLAKLGRSTADVEAILLTHGDGDHVGFAEKLRTASGAPVLIHPADRELATTTAHKKTERPITPYLRHLATWRLLPQFARGGAMKAPPVAEVDPLEPGQVLDVPGKPRVVHTPGHTPGHCVFHFEGSDAVIAGDALCTLNVLTGRTGMQLLPRGLTVDSQEAMRSLDAIEATGASTVLVGHGEPWTGGAAQAAAAARAAGLS